MHWDGDHMGGWGMGMGWLVLALLVLGIVVLIMIMVGIFRGRIGRGPGGDDRAQGPERNRARDMLDERYARGEIDATEYDEKRGRLEIRKDKGEALTPLSRGQWVRVESASPRPGCPGPTHSPLLPGLWWRRRGHPRGRRP